MVRAIYREQAIGDRLLNGTAPKTGRAVPGKKHVEEKRAAGLESAAAD